MKISKKIISVLLATIMLLSCVIPTFANDNEKKEGNAEARNSVSLTVSTDKEWYKRNETVTFHVNVKNNSSKSFKNIRVNMVFNWFKLDCQEGSDIEIDSLKAGEEKTIDFNVDYVRLSIGARLFFRLSKSLSWIFRNVWGFHAETIRDYVRIGGIKYLFIFSVKGGEVVEDNDVVDEIDSDGDGIPDSLELENGSDPYKTDTDGDGLSDYWELNWLNLDPAKKDSDGNGVSDDQEDTDGDGIKNIDEIKYGTNPAMKDTDYDRLSDYEEIFKYKTDPLKEDTDGDGVSDGNEILYGTDPLKADQFFTSEENLGEPTSDFPVVASAKVIGDAESVGTLEIEFIPAGSDVRLSQTIPGYLGYAYNFSIEGKMASAEITFSYDEALGQIGENFQPRIYYFNETDGTLEELENQEVEAGQVTATVTHFSTYILLNKVEFDKVWETEIKPTDYQGDGKTGIDIVFVVDSSGSMRSNDGSGIRKDAVKNFVDKLGKDDRAAVVDFDDSARIYQSFTSDHQDLYSAVDKVDSSGGTSLSAGMKVAINLFTENSYTRTDAYKYIVFLTDGDGDYRTAYTSEALKNNIVVYTVGLGSGVRETVLKNIASGTGGKYYFASTANQLPDIYNDVSFETVDYTTDSNNDGISDYYTKLLCDGEMVLSTGSKILYGIDLNYDMNGNPSDDYDGDGLKNGEELYVTQNGNKVYVEMLSNPLSNDSDYDGYSDYDEVKKMNTSPLNYTKDKASKLNNLLDNSAYVYVKVAHDSSWLKNIYAYGFDWKRTKESKANIINYFYDYASEDSINNSAETIAKVAAQEKFWEAFETIVDITGTLKNVVDAGTKAGCDTEKAKTLKEDCMKAKIEALKKHNEENFKNKTGKDIEILSKQIGVVTASEKAITDIADAITEHGFDEITGSVKTVTGLVAKSISLAKECNKTWKLPLNNSLSNFAKKYQSWMGNTDKLGFSNGDKVGFVFDVVDLAVEVADLNNTYGKIMANTQAFEDYIELIEYISANGNDKKYIKSAASELMSILLDTSWDTYYKKINAAIAKEGLKTLANTAISIVGDFCPYVKAAELVRDIAVTTFSLLGFTAYGQSIVSCQMIDAISDSCIHYVNETVSIRDNFFTYESEKAEMYIIQLVQSRIVGEKLVCDYLKNNDVTNFLKKVFFNYNNKDIDSTFGTIVNGNYDIAKSLNLTLSPCLPVYENGKWNQKSPDDVNSGKNSGGGAW